MSEVETALGNMAKLILLIKARGGYKFRAQIPLSDVQITELESRAEEVILDYAVRCTVAEKMLREKPSSYHERWDEYQGRLREVHDKLSRAYTQRGKGSAGARAAAAKVQPTPAPAR